MKNILVVESSPRGNASFSKKLANAIVEKLQAKHPHAQVTTRDLSRNPTPHLEEAHLAAFFAPAEKHTAADKAAIRHSDESIAEILAADVIVIAVPMYNFTVPSSLKAWIDHICRAGITFRYSPSGSEGLVKGKKVYLAISSGAIYSEGDWKAMDFAEPYMRAVLGFLGMTEVTAIRVEGVSIPGVKDAALDKAIASINV